MGDLTLHNDAGVRRQCDLGGEHMQKVAMPRLASPRAPALLCASLAGLFIKQFQSPSAVAHGQHQLKRSRARGSIAPSSDPYG